MAQWIKKGGEEILEISKDRREILNELKDCKDKLDIEQKSIENMESLAVMMKSLKRDTKEVDHNIRIAYGRKRMLTKAIDMLQMFIAKA